MAAFMVMSFYFLGLLFLLGGLGSCAMSKTSVHEISGLASLMIGFGLLVGGMVVQKLIEIADLLKKREQ